jgi:CubicO group peptidase (beta-lactamase class C family)
MIKKGKAEALFDYLDKCAENQIFPGANFALIAGNETTYTSVGIKQLRPNLKINDLKTMYDIQSLTQLVATTTAILILKDQEKLELDTKIKDILPKFQNKDISIKNCLNHTSGLTTTIEGVDEMTASNLQDFILQANLDFETGTKVVYSDLNFILLGLVIDKITNSFEEFVEENIFKPLNMVDTTFFPSDKKIRFCVTYSVDNNNYHNRIYDTKANIFTNACGHAGLYSTINDLILFMKMLLYKGTYRKVPVLTPESVDLLFDCTTCNLDYGRSLGWNINNDKNKLEGKYSNETIYLESNTGSSILFDRKKELVVILLTNEMNIKKENREISEEVKKIYDLAYKSVK